MRNNIKNILIGLFLASIACPSVSSQHLGESRQDVIANWSQIIGNSESGSDVMPLKLMARFIVKGQDQNCSNFMLVPESAKVNPTAPTAATTRVLPQSENNSDFDITLCQFEMFADWQSAKLYKNGQSTVLASFPGAYNIGRQNDGEIVAIGIGDTGCRSSDCDRDQGVNLPFQKVVEQILTQANKPDFVIHVGDYRYYKEGREPDAWEKWYMEFFLPAQPLLNKAPVAFSRGNHEQCDGKSGYWYGTRWYQFFEPTSSEEVTSCPKDTATLHEPWAFDVAAKTPEGKIQWPYQTVMIDNSPMSKNLSDFDAVVRQMSVNFQTALELSQGHESWWTMHKPIWSYPNEYANTDNQQALLDALEDQEAITNTLCSSNQCNPRATLGGHAHLFQLIDFGSKNWPIQYILGHGGVQTLEGQDIKDNAYEFSVPDNTVTFQGNASVIYNQNGFLKWTRNQDSLNTPSGWITENCLLNSPCQIVSPEP